jgi:hypothetical protein
MNEQGIIAMFVKSAEAVGKSDAEMPAMHLPPLCANDELIAKNSSQLLPRAREYVEALKNLIVLSEDWRTYTDLNSESHRNGANKILETIRSQKDKYKFDIDKEELKTIFPDANDMLENSTKFTTDSGMDIQSYLQTMLGDVNDGKLMQLLGIIVNGKNNCDE